MILFWLALHIDQETACKYPFRRTFASGICGGLRPRETSAFRPVVAAKAATTGRTRNVRRDKNFLNTLPERVHVPELTQSREAAFFFACGSIEGSEVRFNIDHGAMLVEAVDGMISFQFIKRTGEVFDTYTMEKACHTD